MLAKMQGKKEPSHTACRNVNQDNYYAPQKPENRTTTLIAALFTISKVSHN
jgi:hypothetical protein